jgi:hypothetical protein
MEAQVLTPSSVKVAVLFGRSKPKKPFPIPHSKNPPVIRAVYDI